MKKIKANTTTLTRTDCGELIAAHGKTTQSDMDSLNGALHMSVDAVNQKLIGQTHDNNRDNNRHIGFALHYDIYDISADGTHVLLCMRKTEDTRYGQRTYRKKYVLLVQNRVKIMVIDVNQSMVAKHAKNSGGRIGDVINILIEDIDKKSLAAEKKIDKKIAIEKLFAEFFAS